MKLKKGDTIIVTVGKDKGRKGKIDRIFPKDQKVLVPGINIVKKHLKKKDEKNPGGIVEIPKPMIVSKLMLVCPKCGKPTRIGYDITKQDKIRMCKKCHQKI